MKRKPISAEKILRILRRDRFTCQYCGATGVDLEIDHVIPIALGGSNSEINLVTACRKCNRKKGKKLDWEMIQKIANVLGVDTESLLRQSSSSKIKEVNERSLKEDKGMMIYRFSENEALELPATTDFIPIFERIVAERLKMKNLQEYTA